MRVFIRWTALLILALLIVLIPLSLFVFNRFNSNAFSTRGNSSNTVVGHAYFSSLLAQDDTLHISLQNLPASGPGKGYFLWLASPSVNGKSTWTRAVQLAVSNGTGSATYSSPNTCTLQNPARCNLLQSYNQVLLTQEDLDGTPSIPSAPWLYYAQFSNTPKPGTNVSLWDHLHHLLSSDPDLERVNIHNGLDVNFFDMVEAIQKWAVTDRDHVNSHPDSELRAYIVDILFDLDGPCAPRNDLAKPRSSIASQVKTDVPTIATTPIGLLSCGTQLGYLPHIITHLRSLSDAPGVTPDQKNLALQIVSDINNTPNSGLMHWLNQIRSDAVYLVFLPHLTGQPVVQTRLQDRRVGRDMLMAGKLIQ